MKNTSCDEVFLGNLNRDTYTRLMPSPIHGIGVFAIRKIPKGTIPFPDGCDFKYVQVTPEAVNRLNPGVCKLLKDLCVLEGGVYWVPDYGLNQCGVAWFLNHSETPNLGTPEEDGLGEEDPHGDVFFALRDIEVGEELTVDYGEYNDEVGLD